MTASPAWLYYAFGVAMIVVAAYGAVLLALGVATRRTSGWDVDVAHTFMGVAMAGMFVSTWSFGPGALWELVFAGLATLFLVRSAQSILRFGLHVPHESIHAIRLRNGADALVRCRTGRRAVDVDGPCLVNTNRSRPHRARVPHTGLCCLHARFTGEGHLPSRIAHAMRGRRRNERRERRGPSRVVRCGAVIAAPMLEDVSHVAMCVAMAFMLILMN